MSTTRLSSKGQICIPKRIRTLRSWQVGQEFDVIETAEGVLLRPRTSFPPTTLDEVGQALAYNGPAVPVEALGIDALAYRDPYQADHDRT